MNVKIGSRREMDGYIYEHARNTGLLDAAIPPYINTSFWSKMNKSTRCYYKLM